MYNKERAWPRWQGILITAAAYGLGMVLGNILAQILFTVMTPDIYGFAPETVKLLIGLLVVILILALSGGITGFVGGWTLPVSGVERGKYGYAWRSAISYGIPYSTILMLLIFFLSMLTARDSAFLPASEYAMAYLDAGVIFGLLFGLLQGVTTVGIRRTGSVLLASLVGFGLGGYGLGIGIWAYLDSIPPGGIYDGQYIYILLGLLVFGFFGGLGLGWAYHRHARRDREGLGPAPTSGRHLVGYIVGGVLLVLFIAALRPVLKAVGDIMTPRTARFQEQVALVTTGTHWSTRETYGGEEGTGSLDLGVSQDDSLALVWARQQDVGSDVMIEVGNAGGDDEISWGAPVNLSNTEQASENPSVTVDQDGRAHVIWREGEPPDFEVQYAICESGECSAPVVLRGVVCASVPGFVSSTSVYPMDIASNPDGSVMAVWMDASGGLQYQVFPGTESSLGSNAGCILLPEGRRVGTLSLSDAPFGFVVAYDEGAADASQVWSIEYDADGWVGSNKPIGEGILPDIWVSEAGDQTIAWCVDGAGVQVWRDGVSETVYELSCAGKPVIAQDENGDLHIIWYSTQVDDALGQIRESDVLYESILLDSGWSRPAIIAVLEGPGDYAMEEDGSGLLHLTLLNAVDEPDLYYAQQRQYACDETTLKGVEKVLYTIARTGGYRPEGDPIPFCDNRYEKMIFTPNADPAFTDQPPTVNGGYDDYVELLKEAKYEVLFTTMAYEDATNHDSPGAVLADGVYELYQMVKANPEDYPRGMHVRLMLGNSPPITQMEIDGQLWLILKDLAEAGFEQLNDPEVGWELEVANYFGAWPHSHVKTMIIDGKKVVASGFNHEYKPLPKDHPSGKGLGDADTGIVFTGPIAQQTRRIYEEIWDGATQRDCNDLTLHPELWRFTCKDTRGVASVVPEAMRFYPTESEAHVFSMFRNQVYDESDQLVIAAFNSATESLDIAQAMFSMPLVCNLNHFFEVCSFNEALPYMEAIMNAAENGTQVRILLTPYPIQIVENIIASNILLQEAEARGVLDRVEVRYFNDLLHAKNALIDEEFLIIGSQNLHYSAFGEGEGLSEYNLGTSDPEAIAQFQRMFEYYWELAGEQ